MKFEQKSIFFKGTYHLFNVGVSASDPETRPCTGTYRSVPGRAEAAGAKLLQEVHAIKPFN